MITPQDIMEIKNPLVANEIAAWKEGKQTWGTSLMNAVVNLARANAHLTDQKQAPLVAAAREAQELETPPLLQDNTYRINFFKEHGYWPEGMPTKPLRFA